MNLGDGTFEEPVGYAAGTSPRSVAVGDFDGDGDPDLAIANAGSGDVSVLLNAGDGTFDAGAAHGADRIGEEGLRYAAGRSPRSIAVGDLDGDGMPDLAVATGQFIPSHWMPPYFAGQVQILLNTGDGTFAEDVGYDVGIGTASIAASDLDGDGAMDLVVANGGFYGGGSGDVSVLMNLGDGTFAEQIRYAAGAGPQSVAASDLDGDGAADLVVANNRSNDVSVLMNLGDGTFAEEIRYAAGRGPRSVAASDLDGDGAMDLVVANEGSDDVSVLMNTCPPACRADLDGSGDVGSEDLTALLNAWGPCTACLADMNGSGDDWVGFDDLTMLLNAWGPCW